MDVVAALLKLLLDLLLQEVDPQLQAEVLLLQVVQVLRDSAVTRETTVRHDGWLFGGGHHSPPSSNTQCVKRQDCRVSALTHTLLLSHTLSHCGSVCVRDGTGGSKGLWELGGARACFLFYLEEVMPRMWDGSVCVCV